MGIQENVSGFEGTPFGEFLSAKSSGTPDGVQERVSALLGTSEGFEDAGFVCGNCGDYTNTLKCEHCGISMNTLGMVEESSFEGDYFSHSEEKNCPEIPKGKTCIITIDGKKITIENIVSKEGNLMFEILGYRVVSNPRIKKSIQKITSSGKRVIVSGNIFLLMRKVSKYLLENYESCGLGNLKYFR